MKLQAPFPWFGGKSRVAPVVWQALGTDLRNYVEPFFGSGAVLLNRPLPFDGAECVNDKDGFIANFWRAVKADPEAVASHADNPVNEADLHARHSWLVREALPVLCDRLMGNPDYYDAKVAGWWVWGICCWIGSCWCSGKGPWQSVEMPDGFRQLVHLGDRGRGVKRQLVHLGDRGQGVNRQLVHLGDRGRGVNRQLVHLGDRGRGVNRKRVPLIDWMQALADRLRLVRVCCGDWKRVCTPTPTYKLGLCGVFLDPPYSDLGRAELYNEESFSVAKDVLAWCEKNGSNPLLRIALCGYDGEHNRLAGQGWTCHAWKTAGGYSSRGTNADRNRHKERIWFSPHCLPVTNQSLFEKARAA